MTLVNGGKLTEHASGIDFSGSPLSVTEMPSVEFVSFPVQPSICPHSVRVRGSCTRGYRPETGIDARLHPRSFWRIGREEALSEPGGTSAACFCRNMEQERAEPPSSTSVREAVRGAG